MRSLDPAGGACVAPLTAGSVVVSVADTTRNYRGERLKYPRTSCLGDAPSVATIEHPWPAAPTEWLEAMGVGAATRQTFGDLVIHTPHITTRMELPWTFSTFDYRTLCALLFEQCDAEFETVKVDGRTGTTIHTDRGDLTAPLVIDCMGWRRVLGSSGYQPPDAPLSRGLEVHPGGASEDLEIWIDREYVPAGYGWSF